MLNKFLIITLLFYLVAQHDAQVRRPPYGNSLFAQQQPQRRPAVAMPKPTVAQRQNTAAVKKVNVTRLSIIVSGLEGTTQGTGTLLRPQHVPQIFAVAGKTRQYNVPLLITVNSIFIRSLRTDEERRLCIQSNRLARQKHQINPQCQNVMRLNIPLDLIIPTNIESTAIEHENSPDAIDPLALINYGPNAYLNGNSRMTQDLYQMNYAVGDPVRARRVKRGPQIHFKRSNPLFAD